MASASDVKAGGAYYELSAKIDALQAGLGAAEARLRTFAGVVRSVGAGLQNAFSGFATMISGLGRTLTYLGGAVTIPLVAAVRSAASELNELAVSALRVQVPIEKLSALNYVFERVGAGVHQAEFALAHFEAAIFKAATGSAEANRHFLRLSLSAQELSGMRLEDAFLKFADAIARTRNEAERFAAVRDILGRTAVPLLPALRGGAPGIQAAMGAAAGAGRVVTPEDAARVREYTLALRDLQGVLARGLVPVITTLARLFTSTLAPLAAWVEANGDLANHALVAGGALLGLGGALKLASLTVIPLAGYALSAALGLASLAASVVTGTIALVSWTATVNLSAIAVRAWNAVLALDRAIVITLPAAYYAMQKSVIYTTTSFTIMVRLFNGFTQATRVMVMSAVTVSTGLRALSLSVRLNMLAWAYFDGILLATKTALLAVVASTAFAYTALSGAAVVLGILAYKAVTSAQAMGPLKQGLLDVFETGKTAWEGIVEAVKQGDLVLAMKIAWAGIQLVWLQGIESIKDAWGGFKLYFTDTLREMAGGAKLMLGDVYAFLRKRGFESVAETKARLGISDVSVVGQVERGKGEDRAAEAAASAARKAAAQKELADARAELAKLLPKPTPPGKTPGAELPRPEALAQKAEVVGSFYAAAAGLAGARGPTAQLLSVAEQQLVELRRITEGVGAVGRAT